MTQLVNYNDKQIKVTQQQLSQFNVNKVLASGKSPSKQAINGTDSTRDSLNNLIAKNKSNIINNNKNNNNGSIGNKKSLSQ